MKVSPALLALAVGLFGFACPPIAAADARPNLLLIIADDLCWRDLGFTGNQEVKTPNLDQLRDQGMQLRMMFDPATTCSPARHALYTGLHCIRSGAYPNHTRVFDGTKSIFTHLKEAGYRVALQGKEHVGPKPSFPYEYIANADQFADTRKFITRDAAQPWLFVFASHDPHSPWNRGPKDLHDPAKITIPPYLHDNATTRRLLANYYGEINKLDWQVGELMRLLDEAKQAENTLVMFVSEQGSSFPYGGKWSVYDNGIRTATVVRWPGRVKAGSSNDALLQYTDVPPTFLAAAGVDPTKIDTGCPDANGNRGFDGTSFLDVLLGKSDNGHDYVFAQHTTVGIIGFLEPYPMRAVRDARYKYIRNLAPENTYQIGGIHKGEPITSWKADAKTDPILASRVEWLFHRTGEELYDLESDEFETNNRATDPVLAEVKARLAKELDAWMKQQGDQGMATEAVARSRQGRGRAEKEEPEGASEAPEKPTRKGKKRAATPAAAE